MKVLAIVAPSLGKYSETFIANHVKYLDGEKVLITINNGVLSNENSVYIGNHSFFIRLIRYAKRILLKESFYSQQQRILANYLLKRRVTHVLIEYGVTAKVCYRACVNANIPYTIHFHGHDAYKFKYATREFYEDVLNYASNLIVVSAHMKKQLLSLGAELDKIKIIPCGTDFLYKKDGLNCEKSSYFLAVGRFVEKKAPFLTIMAFHEAYRSNNKLKLIMVGDGEYLSLCKLIVRGLGLSSIIEFKGALEHDKVLGLMTGCQGFIQHSMVASDGDSEGLPVAIIEALSLRKPVISTNHSGIPEIVKHGVNGFLSEEGDVLEMSENLLKVASGYNFNFENTKRLNLMEQIQKLNNILS
ncbi:glycosyltransferase [Fulvivirga maritima]|uniref:glycosyltransferase n=1 Tax=Fulvivirga maritima TaxID=2904247 RepID=UPI001F18A7BC|nr:glycosyltransferase [Fulvivirga maritima]UII27790.1 glycosyltransferase [Fulvivirga maritima]